MSQENHPSLFEAVKPQNSLPFGPFAPPEGFDHGPEFAGEPPRSLPPDVRRSRYVRARKSTVWILLMIGSACWATDQLPFVKMLSWYLLPLGYLHWIGAGFLGLAAIYWIRNLSSPGYLNSVRYGEPVIGRIRQVYVDRTGTAEVPQGRFMAEVEFRHPLKGEIQTTVVSAPDVFAMKDQPKMDAGVTAGEYVTLVYLPDRLEKTLQIYGWLGLNPDCDFIRKNGQPLKPISPITGLMVVLGITAIGWLLLGFFYVIGRYTPIDENEWRPFAVGAALLVIPMLVFSLRVANREQVATNSMFRRYMVAVFMALVFTCMTSFVAVGFLNGFFDRSPTHLEPVKIVQLWHETTEFVIRTYQLEFHPYPNGPTTKKMVTVETQALFQPDSLGVIDVGSGWLGMRWIRDFYPIVWQSVPADGAPAIGEISFRRPNELELIRIVPQIVAGDSGIHTPPEVMLPELRQRMAGYLTTSLQATIIEPPNR